MSSIKAVVNIGGGQAEIKGLPFPKLPGPDYMLVKTVAWAINPDEIDKLELPEDETCAGTVMGADFAGYVLEVGSEVKRFKEGDRVAGMVLGQNTIRKNDGSFADVIAAKADAQMKIPDSFGYAEAATQGVAVATMAQALYRGLGLPLPGGTVERSYPIFIYGGSTAMGMEAIQFAKLSGATVIATASPANKELLLSLGADHVVDYSSPGLVDEVRCLSKEPIQFAFDASPSEDSARLVAQVLSRDGKGRYVCLIPGIEEVVRAVNPTVTASSVLAYSVLGEPYWFDKKLFEGVPADLELQKSFARVAEKLLGEGKLRAPRVFLNRGGEGLEGVLHGLEEMRAKKVRGGKLVYTAKGEHGNGGAA